MNVATRWDPNLAGTATREATNAILRALIGARGPVPRARLELAASSSVAAKTAGNLVYELDRFGAIHIGRSGVSLTPLGSAWAQAWLDRRIEAATA